jgi:hypothetical protein
MSSGLSIRIPSFASADRLQHLFRLAGIIVFDHRSKKPAQVKVGKAARIKEAR